MQLPMPDLSWSASTMRLPCWRSSGRIGPTSRHRFQIEETTFFAEFDAQHAQLLAWQAAGTDYFHLLVTDGRRGGGAGEPGRGGRRVGGTRVPDRAEGYGARTGHGGGAPGARTRRHRVRTHQPAREGHAETIQPRARCLNTTGSSPSVSSRSTASRPCPTSANFSDALRLCSIQVTARLQRFT